MTTVKDAAIFGLILLACFSLSCVGAFTALLLTAYDERDGCNPNPWGACHHGISEVRESCANDCLHDMNSNISRREGNFFAVFSGGWPCYCNVNGTWVKTRENP